MNLQKKIATRQSFGEALNELGKENEDIIVLSADLSGATKTAIFEKSFPEKFFNVGIAEQNLMGIAARIGNSTVKYHLLVLLRCLLVEEHMIK